MSLALRYLVGIAAVVAALCAVVGCSSPPDDVGPATVATPPPPKAPSEPTEVVVFAASSLTGVLEGFHEDLTAANPDLAPSANLAGTQELAMQAQQGARFDVFLSASEEDAETLATEGLITDPTPLAANAVCVVVDPSASTITSIEDLARGGVSVVVATDTCPVGRYTRMVWDKMAADEAFGEEWVAAVQGNVVSEETNAKLVLAKVEMGEADAGFVYVTDAVGQDVRTIELPDSVQVEATYMAAVSAAAPQPEAAARYLEALLSEVGATHLRRAGFILPDASPSEP